MDIMQDRVCLDSNCLSYLTDAMMRASKPKDALAKEKIALFRIFLYREATFYVSPSAEAEYNKIRDTLKRKEHQEVDNILLIEIQLGDQEEVAGRSKEYAEFHPGRKNVKDCNLLAEAEVGGCKYFLTYDADLRKRLSSKTHTIKIMTPSELWQEMGLPKGITPKLSPHPTNPLAEQQWWVW